MTRPAHCDYHGECKNKAYAEVFPGMMDLKKTFDWTKVKTRKMKILGLDARVMQTSPFKKHRKFANVGWSYLCRKHLKQEEERFKNQLPYVVVGR